MAPVSRSQSECDFMAPKPREGRHDVQVQKYSGRGSASIDGVRDRIDTLGRPSPLVCLSVRAWWCRGISMNCPVT